MLKLVYLLSALVCVLTAPAPETLQRQLDGRIVGGVATTITSFPWQISLQRSGSHMCGGSIYSDNIIVTAAHCLVGQTVSALKVRVGSSFWNSGGLLIQVAAFKYHELYNSSSSQYDVGIIRLVSPLTFKSTIKPISLATTSPRDGDLAVVSGWGTKKSGSQTIPTQLQYVELEMVSLATCASDVFMYGPEYGYIRDTMICAYSVERDACQGDSGGPLVSNGVLVGVVSWGYGCAFLRLPGVYADVAVLREWLEGAANSI